MLVATVTVRSNRFPSIAGEVSRRASQVVRKTTYDAQANAQAGIVGHDLVDTGALLNSMAAQFLTPLHGRVGPAVHYGIYHEYGTVHLPARPFVGPAAEAVRGPFTAAMRAVMGTL